MHYQYYHQNNNHYAAAHSARYLEQEDEAVGLQPTGRFATFVKFLLVSTLLVTTFVTPVLWLLKSAISFDVENLLLVAMLPLLADLLGVASANRCILLWYAVLMGLLMTLILGEQFYVYTYCELGSSCAEFTRLAPGNLTIIGSIWSTAMISFVYVSILTLQRRRLRLAAIQSAANNEQDERRDVNFTTSFMI